MQEWQEYYNSRKCSAAEAVQLIQSGDHVVFGHNIAEPQALIDAMIENHDAYQNVHIHHMQSLGEGRYTAPEYKDNFHFDGWFLSNGTRQCVAEGYGDVTPNHYSQPDKFFNEGLFQCDVAMITVTPPNEKGFVSLGVSVDYTMNAVKKADRIIAQVNSYMPETNGYTYIHVTEIDRFVECDQPLRELILPKLSDKELAIGEYCASLIPDRATISVGIGTIPAAVCNALKNKHDLGVFTDMMSDSMVDLAEAGVITGKYCTTNPYKMTTSFIMGSRKLYDFVDRNPDVVFMSATYCNHPFRIAKQSNMCIINSTVSVDLMGQIVSSTIGEMQFSGDGGQPSLTLGTALSTDHKGKAIIAMTSSVMDFSGNLVSKITPFIAEGAAVTLTREDADYIVTENGIAHLKGKSLADRSRALIEIADPAFRDELIEEYERRYSRKY